MVLISVNGSRLVSEFEVNFSFEIKYTFDYLLALLLGCHIQIDLFAPPASSRGPAAAIMCLLAAFCVCASTPHDQGFPRFQNREVIGRIYIRQLVFLVNWKRDELWRTGSTKGITDKAQESPGNQAQHGTDELRVRSFSTGSLEL
jgi:hypothetical protein